MSVTTSTATAFTAAAAAAAAAAAVYVHKQIDLTLWPCFRGRSPQNDNFNIN